MELSSSAFAPMTRGLTCANTTAGLLDYVNAGGTLIVQYNQSTSAFNDGHYTPYPATEANVRVSVEEQPVEILAPEERVFNWPNKITQKDFDGWVRSAGSTSCRNGIRNSSRCWRAMIRANRHRKAACCWPTTAKAFTSFLRMDFRGNFLPVSPGAIRLVCKPGQCGHQ